MRKTAETLTRQWAMLKHVPAHPNRISTSDLHSYLNGQGYEADVRTTQRDLERLSTEFPLYVEKQGRVNLWQWAKGAHALEIPSMEPATALVFNLVEQYLQPLLPKTTLALIQPYLDRAHKKLEGTRFQGWRKNIRMLSRGPSLKAPPIKAEIRDVVYSALMEGKRFQARYRSRSQGRIADYPVNPLGLVIKDGISYLVATLHDYDDPRHLALHRFESAKLQDQPIKRIKGFDLESYLQQTEAFAYPVSKGKLKLKARFSNAAAYHLQESQLANDQQLNADGEDYMLLTATVPDNSEIRWWLLGFGDQVEVLSPKLLRVEFQEIARNMAKSYA